MAPCRRPKVRRSRRQHSEVPSSHPRVSPSATHVPAFCSFPSYSDGPSRVRPPPSSREVGTLPDPALEPCSRRPAPGHQPIRLRLGSRRTWGWCLPARSRLCERTNEAFDLPTNRGRQKPSEPSAYAAVGFGETILLRPSRRPIRSALSSRAMVLIERVPAAAAAAGCCCLLLLLAAVCCCCLLLLAAAIQPTPARTVPSCAPSCGD